MIATEATADVAVAEALGVSKRFGATRALRDVSISIGTRESRALVGRNGAGKSTLVGVLTGLVKPDGGEVRFHGAPAPEVEARERWREEVACVYQRSTVIPTLTVGENLFLNAHPTQRQGFVSWKNLRTQARRLLDDWGIQVDVDAKAADLTVGQRQLTEIARALRLGSRFIILDEPTARLEAAEIDELFEHMQRLKGTGVSFLFISHHLEEIYEICETVTVLRDGEVVETAPVERMDKEAVVRAMVGGAVQTPGSRMALGDVAAHRQRADRGPVLEVRDLTIDGWCADVDLEVAAGEIVGLAGLAGCGKEQVADAIAGMLPTGEGRIAVVGAAVPSGRVDRAIDAGLGYLPGDRLARGFAPNLSVDETLTMTVWDRLAPLGLISPRERRRRAEGLIDGLDIKVAGPRQLVTELSGGNQQKTVLGRALASGPVALVLVSPTAGVDIASKEILLQAIRGAGDIGVLLVSDELDELAVCDRVLVMFGGRIAREFGRERADDELVAAMEGVRSDG